MPIITVCDECGAKLGTCNCYDWGGKIVDIKYLKGQLEHAKRYIKRLETQNDAMRKRINDPDRFPPVRKEDMFA